MKYPISLLLTFLFSTVICGQVSPTTGQISSITTNFSFTMTDGQYNRPILKHGWSSGIGDYMSFKHGGNNTEANTYGFRISDGYGFDFGRNDFADSFFKISTSGKVGVGTTSPDEKFHLEGNLLLDAYGMGTENGLFFREGFSNSNKYNLSILIYDDGDNSSDALALNAYDGFYFNTGSNNKNTRMFIHQNGNIGIGTTTPDAKLTVKGNIHAEEVKVDLSVPGPDYVFKEGYDLKSLEEVQNHIKEHGRLPNIPSAKYMETNGIDLGDMNMKLLEKIEELTLYTIQLKKELELEKNNNVVIQKELGKIKEFLNIK